MSEVQRRALQCGRGWPGLGSALERVTPAPLLPRSQREVEAVGREVSELEAALEEARAETATAKEALRAAQAELRDVRRAAPKARTWVGEAGAEACVRLSTLCVPCAAHRVTHPSPLPLLPIAPRAT